MIIRWAKKVAPQSQQQTPSNSTGEDSPAPKKPRSIVGKYLMKQVQVTKSDVKSVKQQLDHYLNFTHDIVCDDGEVQEIDSIKFWTEAGGRSSWR